MISNRSNSISSSVSDESSSECSSSSSSTSSGDIHTLYVHVNGEYVPIAKTCCIIQQTKVELEPKPIRKKNFACTYPECPKRYYKSSHLKAHYRLHTGLKMQRHHDQSFHSLSLSFHLCCFR